MKKPIDNINDLISEIQKGNKKIGVTDMLYTYLKFNIPSVEQIKGVNCVGFYNGVTIYIDDELEGKDNN